MSKKPCAVTNCFDTTSRRYCFPRNAEVCEVWAQRIENDNLKVKNVSQLIKMCVCAHHFSHLCFDDDGNLKTYALPTLNLPTSFELTKENSFLYMKKDLPEIKSSQTAAFAEAIPGPSMNSPSPKVLRVTGLKIYGRGKRLFSEISDLAVTTKEGVKSSETENISTPTESVSHVQAVARKKPRQSVLKQLRTK